MTRTGRPARVRRPIISRKACGFRRLSGVDREIDGGLRIAGCAGSIGIVRHGPALDQEWFSRGNPL